RTHEDPSASGYESLIKLRIFVMGEAFVVTAKLAKNVEIENRMMSVLDETCRTAVPVNGAAVSYRRVLGSSHRTLEAIRAFGAHGYDDRVGTRLKKSLDAVADKILRV